MELTFRPFATSGVALAAAGVIALVPIASPRPEVHASPPPAVSQAVRLMVDPITAYQTLISDTVTSLQNLGSLAISSPQGLLPILQQFLTNQLTYAQDLGGGLVTGSVGFVNELLTVSLPLLKTAATQLLAGKVFDATLSLVSAILDPPAVFFDALTAGVQAVLNTMAKHITHLFADYGSIASLLYPGLTVPPFAALVGVGEAVQNVVDALNPFNPVGLLDAFIAAPAVFLNNTLNAPAGLLGSAGPIGALLQVRNIVAAAIDPPPPPWLSRLAPANATPKTPAKTVTLSTAGITTGTKPTTGPTTPAAKGTSLSTPGKTATATAVLDKPGGLGLKHQTGITAKK